MFPGSVREPASWILAVGAFDDMLKEMEGLQSLAKKPTWTAAREQGGTDDVSFGTLAEELGQIIAEIAEIIEAQQVLLLLLDDPETLVTVASHGFEPAMRAGTRIDLADTPAETLLQSREARTLPEGESSLASVLSRPYASGQAVMIAPLVMSDRVFGLIETVQADSTAVDARRLQLLSVLANWVGHAVRNIMQQEGQRRQLEESEAIADISSALLRTLEPGEILQLIVDIAKRVIPQVEQAVIHLLDEEEQILKSAAVAGQVASGEPSMPLRPGQGIAGMVMAEGQTINVSNILEDGRFKILGREPKMLSLLVAPVESRIKRLGTISVQSAVARAFSIEDERLLTTLGLQAALALDNAQLFERERAERQRAEKQAKELAASERFLAILNKISRDALRVTGLPELLQTIADDLRDLYRADKCYITVWDSSTRRLRMGAVSNAAAGLSVSTAEPGLEFELSESIIKEGAPIPIPQASNSPYIRWDSKARSADGSLLALPLQAGGDPIGAAIIGFAAPRQFSERELSQGKLTSRQIALAIANARLLQSERQARQDAEALQDELQAALEKEKSIRARLVQAEKLSAMGKMVASVAHELNNPLQGIQNVLYLVSQDRKLSVQSRQDLEVMSVETDRMADLINRLRETYRPVTAGQFSPEDMNLILQDVQRLTATHCRHQGVAFEFRPVPDLPAVACIADQMKQVMLNLALNAVDAMPDGGTLRVQVAADEHDQRVTISFTDNGLGIPEADLPHVFDPFFTTKEKGTGLGLSITYDIVQQHAGTIEVFSQPGETCFVVSIPVSP